MSQVDVDNYKRDGYVSPMRFVSEVAAQEHRRVLEDAEAKIGALHYKVKMHTILRSPWELATLPAVLDVVEGMIGPNILLYNATYIIKEPHSSAFVSWHQDLTYWGLSHDDQVTMWLALSPATLESGCMRMIPKSHRQGRLDHAVSEDSNNVLFQSQTVQGVSEDQAVYCPLTAGEASFHHGWTLHVSMPNESADRRIGLNVQYLATHVRQTKDPHDTAILVRGEDNFRHYSDDVPATADLAPEALLRQKVLEEHYKSIAASM